MQVTAEVNSLEHNVKYRVTGGMTLPEYKQMPGRQKRGSPIDLQKVMWLWTP